MVTGFGIDPILDTAGLPTSGTSSADIRNITAGLFTPGVISGAKVSTSASTMQYIVSAGVIAVKIAEEEVVLAPVKASTVSTTAPASGSRTDIIYAQQSVASVEGSVEVVVRVGTTLPARSVMLGSRVVKAGILNTNASIVTGNITYSVPYGASMGILHQYRDPRNGIINHSRTVVNTKSLTLPTDRLIRVSIGSNMSARDAGRWDASKACTVGYDVMIDGAYRSHFGTPTLDKSWGTYSFSDVYALSQGTHTFKFEMLRSDGPGFPVAHYGSGWQGTLWTVEDIGPVA